MGATISLTPAEAQVAPGAEAVITVSVRNSGTVVDEFSFQALGEVTGWTEFDPPRLSLFPQSEGSVLLRLRPPRLPSTAPGRVPFGVRAVSKEHPEDSAVEEGVVVVEPFADVVTELVPRTSRGRRRAAHSLAVDNRGNQPLNAALAATDPDAALRYRFSPPSLSTAPGSASFADLVVTPAERFWRGTPRTRTFRVLLEQEGAPPITVDGTMLQEPLIPHWLPRAVAAALAALVALAVLWLALLRPEIKSAAREAVEEELGGRQVTDPGGGGGGPDTGEPGSAPSPGASPAVAAGGERRPAVFFDERLSLREGRETDSFEVPNNRTLSLTDVVFHAPFPQVGSLDLLRGDRVLLSVRLENFRNLDYHFVTPIVFGEGQSMRLRMSCEQPSEGRDDCVASAYLVGVLR